MADHAQARALEGLGHPSVLFAAAVWCAQLMGLTLWLEPTLQSAGVPLPLVADFVEAELMLTGALGVLAGVWAWRVLSGPPAAAAKKGTQPKE